MGDLTLARTGKSCIIFGVQFPNLAVALRALNVTYIHENALIERFGSIESYIQYKYPELTTTELTELCVESAKPKKPENDDLFKHIQLAINVYLNNSFCLGSDSDKKLLKDLATSKDFKNLIKSLL